MDSSEDGGRAVAAIAGIEAVPTLLKVFCEIAGMRRQIRHPLKWRQAQPLTRGSAAGSVAAPAAKS